MIIFIEVFAMSDHLFLKLGLTNTIGTGFALKHNIAIKYSWEGEAMIQARADKVILEDVNHRLWVVYAKNGIFTHKRRVYKSFKPALDYANSLMHHYQISELTEVMR